MEIGSLEAEVLEIVRRLGRASARKVLKEIYPKRDVAYTTISTTLDRLYKKGLVEREEERFRGKPIYHYSTTPRQGVEVGIVKKSLTRLIQAFGPSVVSAAYSDLTPISKEELEKLKDKIKRAEGRS